jgi:hypothetical protein
LSYFSAPVASHNESELGDKEDIDFNERFQWTGPDEMQERYRAALERGLPFPILTVAEILNMDQEGFSWGRQYREAGYYAGILLWYVLSTLSLIYYIYLKNKKIRFIFFIYFIISIS